MTNFSGEGVIRILQIFLSENQMTAKSRPEYWWETLVQNTLDDFIISSSRVSIRILLGNAAVASPSNKHRIPLEFGIEFQSENKKKPAYLAAE